VRRIRPIETIGVPKEIKYGLWRGFIDNVVARYLDCRVADTGFARLKCEACGAERLLMQSADRESTLKVVFPFKHQTF
jgi:hypothetical protein